ncbi:hypothetical protein E2C01_098812 [Portunus trituberculatus]|uniref:Uncharacterized protein n=1 Tax=Portunus trituberculatus TaxID=210409 RepID=A0A5B7K9C5_PORTR|nr:hypothetical protein [Portunus trituberculatus]
MLTSAVGLKGHLKLPPVGVILVKGENCITPYTWPALPSLPHTFPASSPHLSKPFIPANTPLTLSFPLHLPHFTLIVTPTEPPLPKNTFNDTFIPT